MEHDFLWLDEEAFSASPSDSNDYVIMGKTAGSAIAVKSGKPFITLNQVKTTFPSLVRRG